jgi:hypothetical protein
MNWIKEHFIASSMALVVLAVATWATPVLVLMALTTTLIVPTRLALGARAWPENGLDSVIEHLAVIFIFFLSTMFLIGVAFVVALELLGGSDGLILWFTAAMVFDCAACTVWIAKWTVDDERAKAAVVGSRIANSAPTGAGKRVQA